MGFVPVISDCFSALVSGLIIAVNSAVKLVTGTDISVTAVVTDAEVVVTTSDVVGEVPLGGVLSVLVIFLQFRTLLWGCLAKFLE